MNLLPRKEARTASGSSGRGKGMSTGSRRGVSCAAARSVDDDDTDEEDEDDIDVSAECLEDAEELGDLPESTTTLPSDLKFSFGQTELSPPPIFKELFIL